MSVIGNRRGGNPVTLNLDKSCTRLKRVAFTEKKFQEGWLQDLIETNPEILPIDDIEPAFASPVSVGREVSTKSGFIDNLLLSPRGYLTIVETKLWRNPEARRQVVAQLIDYAKDISYWTFQQLDKEVRNYNMQRNHSNFGILDTLRQKEEIDEIDEPVIVDTISRNLKTGRLLLLAVGDGIRESVEEMAEFLQKTPQLHFTLALVELQLYELGSTGNMPYIVIPQIVARTAEVTRAVVRVEGKDIDSIKISVEPEITTVDKLEAVKLVKRGTLTEDDYFSALKQNVNTDDDYIFAIKLKRDMEELGCTIQWKKASFVVTLPDPGKSGQQLSLLVVPIDGRVYIRPELKDQLGYLGLPEQIALDYARQSCKLFNNCQESQKSPGSWSRTVSLKELREQYGEYISVVRNIIDQIREAAKKQTSG